MILRTSKRSAGLAVVIAAVAALSMVTTGCTATVDDPAPTAHPVTTEEAQLLAIARFTNFDIGSRPFMTTLRQSGAELTIRGWVDYGSEIGYAAVTGDFDPQVLLWTASTVGIATQAPDPNGNPRLPIPPTSDQAWQSHPIDASTSTLDTVLVVIGNLGKDRPDNPLLTQQSGALWLRTDSVDGTAVTVFAAPPSDAPVTGGVAPSTKDASLKLWVDGKGLIRRAELRLDDGWITVDFPDSPAPRLALSGEPNG